MKISNLPFIWRLKDRRDAPAPNGLPTTMDFEWDWDSRFGLLRQARNRWLDEALAMVYRAGSENLGADAKHHDNFRHFVEHLTPEIGVRLLDRPGALTLLDIGGGRFSALDGKLHGFDVYNVDPSADYHRDPLAYQHRGIFPCELPGSWPRKFDVITLNHVLEHVVDPLEVLNAAADLLAPGGTVIIAVPDCTESVRLGDISMACHQHLSYFTEESLELCLRHANLFARIHSGQGTIFAVAQPNISKMYPWPPQATYGTFAARAWRNQRYIADFITFTGIYAHDTAIAVPMRVLPYVPNWSGAILDDGMAGKFLDGLPEKIAPICPLGERIRNVFVMSLTHERAIVDKLAGRCKVITLREMLNAW